jgi:hypothetical protein
VGAASGGGGRQLAVRGGCTQRCGARGVVESFGKRPERAICGGSATVGMTVQWGAKGEEGRKGTPRWGRAPFIAARGGGRRQCGGGETVGEETVAARPWAWARQGRLLSKSGQRGLGAVGLRD